MNTKLKILFLTNIPAPYRVDFFNELGKYCNLTVVFEGDKALDRDDKWKVSESCNFTAIHLKGLRIDNDKFFSFKIIDILNKKWDIIIIGGYSTPTSILAIEYLRVKRKKFIIEADGGFISDDSWIKYKLKKHLISAASWWFSSGYETTKYLVYYGAIKDKCYWFPFSSLTENDIKKAIFLRKYNRSKIKQKLNIHENQVILSVGRFIKSKGFDILIKAVRNIKKDVGVYIVGGKPTKEYQELKEIYGLNNLKFIDFQSKDDIVYYYAVADVFVLPTRNDVWGLVINEAMSFALPVITTDKCIAGLELVDDENGRIIPVNDIKCLSIAINSILNSNNIEEMGKKSLDRIRKYTIENMAYIHYEILTKINSGGV